MRMRIIKIYSFILPGKYIHTLATSNVSFLSPVLMCEWYSLLLGQLSRIFKVVSIRAHGLVVSYLRSKTKGFWFESGY